MNKLVGRVFRALCVLFLMLPLSWAMAAGETEVPAEPGQAATLEKQLQDLQEEQKSLVRQNAEFDLQLKEAPDLIVQMRRQIQALEKQSVNPKIPRTAEAMDAAIELLDAQVKSMQLGLSDVMDRISHQQELPTVARDQVEAAQKQIQAANEQLRVALQADQTVLANRLEVQVLKQQLANGNLRKEISQNSLEGYQKLLEMYTVNRDLLMLRMGALKSALDLLRAERDSLRQKTAEEQQEQVAKLQTELAQKPAPLVTQLEENQRLLTVLSTITDSLASTNDQITHGKQELQDIRYRFDIAQQQLQLTDFHQYVDDYLLRQRQNLQVRIKEQDSSDLTGQISQARLDQFKFDDQRHSVRTAEARQRRVDKVLAKMPDLDEATRAQYALDLADIMAQREDTLSKLLEVNAKYVVGLTNLELLNRDQQTERQQFFDLLNQKLMWRRSGKPLNLAWVEKMPGSVMWFVTHPGWLELVQVWFRNVIAPVFPLFGLALVAGLLYWPRQRFIDRLALLRDNIGNVMKDQFRYSVTALAITLFLSVPVPLLIMLVAYPLVLDSSASLFVSSVGEGLFALARWVLMVEFVRNLCRENGMASAHFSWRPSAIGALQRWLPMLYWQMPWAFVFIVVWGEGDEDHAGLLGRAAYIIMAIQFWFFLRRLMSPANGLIQKDDSASEMHWYQTWNRQLFWVAMAVPTVLILLALQGFNFSAMILHVNLYQTFMLGFMIFILDQVLTRWFAVQERKIALERALAKREAMRKAKEQQEAAKITGDGVPDVDIPTIDVATISEQNRVMLRVMSYSLFVAAVYWTWQDMFQAVEFFNEIVLWTYSLDNTANAEQIPVTLGSLIITAIVAALTYVGVKNLPGLIEVMVLQRFGLDTGVRFAVTTTARYLVFIAGTMVVSDKIGLDWSKLGWLVAALGVGLGFGLQEIFANFVSGLIILYERPIRIGDTVTINDRSGTVSRIRMRSTTITDADKRELIIPNKTFITNWFINWTLSDNTTRLVVPVSVVEGANIRLVSETLLAIAQDSEHVLRDPAPSSLLLGFGSGTMNFELRVFVNLNKRSLLLHDMNTEIQRRFAELGIEMPSSAMDVHLTRISEQPAPAGAGQG